MNEQPDPLAEMVAGEEAYAERLCAAIARDDEEWILGVEPVADGGPSAQDGGR